MNTHVLVIGINDYPGSNNDLNGCVNDARDISRLMSPNHGTHKDAIEKTPFFHNANSLVTLINNQAKLKPVIEAVGTVLTKLHDGDTAFIWFSSHGTFTDDSERHEALVCHDFGLWVDTKVVSLISKRNPKSLVVFGTDACHTGTRRRDAFGRTIPRFLQAADFPVDEKPNQLPGTRAMQKLLPPGALKNVIHFAGCQDTEVCYDTSFNGRPNGAFTYYLIKALSSLTPGATYGDWFNAACKYLPSGEYPQAPCCNALPDTLAMPLPLRKG